MTSPDSRPQWEEEQSHITKGCTRTQGWKEFGARCVITIILIGLTSTVKTDHCQVQGPEAVLAALQTREKGEPRDPASMGLFLCLMTAQREEQNCEILRVSRAYTLHFRIYIDPTLFLVLTHLVCSEGFSLSALVGPTRLPMSAQIRPVHPVALTQGS